MLTSIQDSLVQLLPIKRKKSTNGWTSFNAPCCHHRGERPDTRGRGGVIMNSDGSVSYHCFNCGFKTGYRPGWHLGYQFRKLLSWLGADENEIRRLLIDAIRIKDIVGPLEESSEQQITFRPRSLPNDLAVVDTDAVALKYCQDRQIDLGRYPMFVSKLTDNNLNRRVIIPYTWKNQLIGYSARTWDPMIKPKYFSQYEPNYVFNIDQQRSTSKFVIVTEGPFDAMSIDAVAVLSNECSETQADIIDSLAKEVIVVPDNDRSGNRLITNAIEYGWSVSFPIWFETCKDINQAVVRYGKLFTMKSILAGKEQSRLKIELKRKKLYN